MKRILINIVCAITVIAAAFSFTACTTKAKSAYEIAVDNGFRGTEAEWLESLKGSDGKDGQDRILTIEEMYEAAKNDGYTGTMNDFIKDYIGANIVLPDEKTAINKALFSVCDVIVTYTTKDSQSIFGTVKGETKSSAGAGVVYSLDKEQGDALVITNYHVVYSSDSVNVDGISDDINLYFYGYEYTSGVSYAVPATYVGGSMTYDIAVLKVEDSDLLKKSDVCAVEVNPSDRTVVGSTAIAVGNPEGTGIAASSGIVSVDSEYITMTAADDKTSINYRCIRVDCAINPGNSGGGLFDGFGRLIGIVNAKVVSDNVDNIGYAIPASLATKVADNIIRNAENGSSGVKTARLGITIKTGASKAVYDSKTATAKITEDVIVQEVTGDTVKGSVEVGDVVVSIAKNDGEAKQIERRYDLTDYMLTTSEGDKITLVVRRNVSGESKELTFNFTLKASNFVSVK